MAIEGIDLDLCNGCGICSDTCTADVIRMNDKEKKAVVKYREDCTSCALCEYFCPQHAIYVAPGRGLM